MIPTFYNGVVRVSQLGVLGFSFIAVRMMVGGCPSSSTVIPFDLQLRNSTFNNNSYLILNWLFSLDTRYLLFTTALYVCLNLGFWGLGFSFIAVRMMTGGCPSSSTVIPFDLQLRNSTFNNNNYLILNWLFPLDTRYLLFTTGT